MYFIHNGIFIPPLVFPAAFIAPPSLDPIREELTES
jgi:hypothetical protein